MKKLIIIIVFVFVIVIYINRDYFFNTLLKESVNIELFNNIKNKLSSPKSILESSLSLSPKVFNLYEEDESFSDNFLLLEEDDKEETPTVYIYNTHQTEEYNAVDYIIKPNVMVASYIFKEKLKQQGISSVIETNSIKEYLEANDLSYSYSYHASEYYAREMQKRYPSIIYMFDLHRDSVDSSVAYMEINEKPYSRMYFLVGYGHTLKENNTGFAERLEEICEELYPGLSRGVYYYSGPSIGEYNSNLNGKSILLEIGGVDSKIEEVNNSLEALSIIFKKYLEEQ